MSKIFSITCALVTLAVVLTSCEKNYDELYQNPNKPTTSTPALNLSGVLKDMLVNPSGMEERWAQYYLINYDYYGNNRYDFGTATMNYTTLSNVVKMEEEAQKLGYPERNPYTALGKFFRAYFFTNMSLKVGDVPMTDALKGVADMSPAYDTQKKVFTQSLAWLEEANTDLTELIKTGDETLTGDYYLGNNMKTWQKVVNTFRLRLLIHLSLKADDAGLNVKQQFADILANPAKYPVMTSAADNLQFTYVFPTDLYPNNPGNFGFDALRYNTSATYIKLLTDRKDPRVFITAEPAGAQIKNGVSPTSFDAFIGANPGEDLGAMYTKTNLGGYSLLNRKHYYDTFTGEPAIIIGYPEMLFNIAEGINRGWAAGGALGGAEAYYKAGIQASMDFYKIPASGDMQVYFLDFKDASLGNYVTYTVPVDFATYYAQPLVKYAADATTGLNQILIQKYLAMFRQSGLESYYTYRRTGQPAFGTGPGTGNSGRIALRFKYPTVESAANSANYNDALSRQYAGNDDINARMWLLQ